MFFFIFLLYFLIHFIFFFFFNDTATTEIYTLSLHDALPICNSPNPTTARCSRSPDSCPRYCRSEEHTSELQSREKLVCRLLLEKKTKYHLPTRPCPRRIKPCWRRTTPFIV